MDNELFSKLSNTLQRNHDLMEKISFENENVTKLLKEAKEVMVPMEKLQERREIKNDKEALNVHRAKEMIQRAAMEQQEASERLLGWAEEQTREKEKLHNKIIKLERKLEAKKGLELEIQQLRDALPVKKHMLKDIVDADGKSEIEKLREELKNKEEDLKDLKELNQILIVKERQSHDERQGIWKELIYYLVKDKKIDAHIGMKRIGKLDTKPFVDALAAKSQFPDDAECRALELSLENEYIRDPSWSPFKIVEVDGKAMEEVDEDNEKVKKLKSEWGNEACHAVITALKELKEANMSCMAYAMGVWNFKEGRKATLKEGVTYIVEELKLRKRKRG